MVILIDKRIQKFVEGYLYENDGKVISIHLKDVDETFWFDNEADILSFLFILGIMAYFKVQDVKACNYSQTHQIDWGKVNNDRVLNDLSNSQVNKNISSGKYDKPILTNKSCNDTWENFKKRHPHGSWN